MNKEELEKELEVKYISIKKALLTSRTVICSYISGITGFFANNGKDLLNQLSDALPQLQSVLDPHIFGYVSLISIVGAIYFKIKSTSIVSK